MRLALVTDAWFPQINGVVRTLSRVKEELEALGHEVAVIAPHQFKTLPCPTYPEIRLALFPGRKVRQRLRALQPQAIHIATEGSLGLAARRYCLKHKLPFTTSYHTRFPEYVSARGPIPLSWGYRVMRWFHGASAGVMVATASLRDDLTARGFTHLKPWTRGVETTLFQPRAERLFDLPRPIFLYVGRVAVEKNIGAFLSLDLPGSKVVIGGGPQLAAMQKQFPTVHFTGAKTGEDLARHFASGDVFVFPSRTDTFGLVILEALACGLPVAAFPVTGPIDILKEGVTGSMNEDLRLAALACVGLSGETCRQTALSYSWPATAQLFLQNLAPFA